MPITAVQAAERRYRAGRFLQYTHMSARGRCIALWNYVLQTEIQGGSQFIRAQPGNQLYIVLGDDHRVISLPASGRGGGWHSYFATAYGFGEREPHAKWCYDALRAYVAETGTKVEMRRFAAYDLLSQTVYMSRYDGRFWRLDGSDEITTMPCGDDNVFFADDDGGLPCEPDIGNHGILLDRLTSINYAAQGLSGITPDQQRKAMIIWAFALAFPDLMPTKPLLLLEGTQGSGKCLGRGTPVLMADGAVKPVEEIRMGDRLMGPDGNARLVQSTTADVGPLYRVTPVKGSPWVCNDAHILTLVSSDTDEIVDMPLSQWNAMKPWRQNRWKQFSVGVARFEGQTQTLPVDPYFLGLWFGDGSREQYANGNLKKVHITKPDPEVLACCQQTAKDWGLHINHNGIEINLSSSMQRGQWINNP